MLDGSWWIWNGSREKRASFCQQITVLASGQTHQDHKEPEHDSLQHWTREQCLESAVVDGLCGIAPNWFTSGSMWPREARVCRDLSGPCKDLTVVGLLVADLWSLGSGFHLGADLEQTISTPGCPLVCQIISGWTLGYQRQPSLGQRRTCALAIRRFVVKGKTGPIYSNRKHRILRTSPNISEHSQVQAETATRFNEKIELKLPELSKTINTPFHVEWP